MVIYSVPIPIIPKAFNLDKNGEDTWAASSSISKFSPDLWKNKRRPVQEHELNGWTVLTGRFTGEVQDAGFDGIMASKDLETTLIWE